MCIIEDNNNFKGGDIIITYNQIMIKSNTQELIKSNHDSVFNLVLLPFLIVFRIQVFAKTNFNCYCFFLVLSKTLIYIFIVLFKYQLLIYINKTFLYDNNIKNHSKLISLHPI